MKTWILVVVGALLIAAVPTTALLLASHESTQTSVRMAAGHGNGHGHGHAFGRHQYRGHVGRRGPFADFPGQGMRPRLRQQLQQWHSLTPQQRARKLSALARQRADALQAWADCLAKATTPASCRPPLPPGLSGFSRRQRPG